jgi:hypothetical protein
MGDMVGDCLEAAVDYERWKLPPLLSSGLGGRPLQNSKSLTQLESVQGPTTERSTN